MLPDASRCVQMLLDAFRCFQMAPDASRCALMLPHARRGLQMLSSAFTCPIWFSPVHLPVFCSPGQRRERPKLLGFPHLVHNDLLWEAVCARNITDSVVLVKLLVYQTVWVSRDGLLELFWDVVAELWVASGIPRGYQHLVAFL